MGRTLKRVPLNFNWPLKTIWGGYVNPFSQQSITCPSCKGRGTSKQAQHLCDLWYGRVPFQPKDRGSIPFVETHPIIQARAEHNVACSPEYYGTGKEAVMREAKRLCKMYNAAWCHHLNEDDIAALVKHGRLMDLTHTWTSGDGWQPKQPAYMPSVQEVNEWSLEGLGHDSINEAIVVQAECIRMGVPDTCDRCKGEGRLWPSQDVKRQSEEWTRLEPPQGDGFQLWETTSEGSPISPVFATLEELCKWAEDGATTFGDHKTQKEEWMRMLESDLVCYKDGNKVFV